MKRPPVMRRHLWQRYREFVRAYDSGDTAKAITLFERLPLQVRGVVAALTFLARLGEL